MPTAIYNNARSFIYRNARPLDFARWRYFFENGSAQDVLCALAAYQNADGGFGHGLEADCLNPDSTPIQTWSATMILRSIDLYDPEHPIVSGIVRYLESGAAFDGHCWAWSISSNNDHPRAIWWTWENKEAFNYNPTAALAAFILRYARRDSVLYRKGLAIAQQAIDWLLAQDPFAEKHVVFLFMQLAHFTQGHPLNGLDRLHARLMEQVPLCVCTDLSKYGVEYVDRPTDLIDGPSHPFYPVIAEAAKAECRFLIDSQQEDGAWPVPWQWYNEYKDEFAVARVWWQGHIVLKHITYLKNFGAI